MINTIKKLIEEKNSEEPVEFIRKHFCSNQKAKKERCTGQTL